jgi:hypothetical protein
MSRLVPGAPAAGPALHRLRFLDGLEAVFAQGGEVDDQVGCVGEPLCE